MVDTIDTNRCFGGEGELSGVHSTGHNIVDIRNIDKSGDLIFV